MAVDVYSDHFVAMNSSPSRFDHSLVDFDFAFNVDTNIAFQSSTADELFCNGKILPTAIVKKEAVVAVNKIKRDEIVSVVPPCSEHPSETRFDSTKKSLKEFLEDSFEEEEEINKLTVTKPFWKFRRSNSLNNCDSRNHKKGLIGSSWKILSRSGSTGKFLEKIVEESEEKKVGFLRKFSRNNSLSCNNNSRGHVNSSSEVLRRSNSTSDNYVAKTDTKSFRRSYSTGSALLSHGRDVKSTQKGQKKNGNKGCELGGYYSKNVKINPVLNLPSPYISRVSVDLFGIGSLFCNGSVKDRKNRK
ncbi:hypothetical protein vseg_004723 [Gypsophila vaccaria]